MKRCLVAFILVLAMGLTAGAQQGSSGFLAKVDHLVYATPDLDTGIKTIEQLLGVRASAGGPWRSRK